MSDLQTTTLLVGLAVALARAVEWLAKASLKKNERNGNGSKSAGLTANEWKSTIKEIVKDALEETQSERNETLRQIIRDELRRL